MPQNTLYDVAGSRTVATGLLALFPSSGDFREDSRKSFALRRNRGTVCIVFYWGREMSVTSDKLRVISRSMPFSVPPLEGGALIVLMIIWAFG